MTNRSFVWCWWHRGWTWHARLIDWVDAGSGHGGRDYYACPPCRKEHGLVPLADRPRAEARR